MDRSAATALEVEQIACVESDRWKALRHRRYAACMLLRRKVDAWSMDLSMVRSPYATSLDSQRQRLAFIYSAQSRATVCSLVQSLRCGCVCKENATKCSQLQHQPQLVQIDRHGYPSRSLSLTLRRLFRFGQERSLLTRVSFHGRELNRQGLPLKEHTSTRRILVGDRSKSLASTSNLFPIPRLRRTDL